MDQTQVLQLRNVFFSFIGYLQQCLHRINVYFVSILVLLYRIRSFFHLLLLSYFIDFVSFRYILFSYFTDFVASFRWISFSYFTDFVSFRWISFSYITDFVGFCFRFVSFRFFSFLSLPVPLITLISSKYSNRQSWKFKKHVFVCLTDGIREMAANTQQTHRPGVLKQSNKSHKHGKHRSKGSLERETKGNTEIT